jgi:hypothetical protein
MTINRRIDPSCQAAARAAVSSADATFGDQFAAFSGASDDGSAVFFSTTGPVIASDVDGVSDVYGAYTAP